MNSGQSGISYILVDYENVQPNDFEFIPEAAWRVMVFLGLNQRPHEGFLKAKERLDKEFSYVRVQRVAKNAVDFHIAYYLGVLTDLHPRDCFYVVSKDKGYDPLLEYLKSGKKIAASRVKKISEIGALVGK